MDTYHLPAQLLKALAHPARLRILNALRDDEECVCHLTALLKQRQAYVSQHLMFLRQAGLIEDRKEGLRVYYRITDPRIFQLLDLVNAMVGVPAQEPEQVAGCPCPQCERQRPRQVRSLLKSSGRSAQTTSG